MLSRLNKNADLEIKQVSYYEENNSPIFHSIDRKIISDQKRRDFLISKGRIDEKND